MTHPLSSMKTIPIHSSTLPRAASQFPSEQTPTIIATYLNSRM